MKTRLFFFHCLVRAAPGYFPAVFSTRPGRSSSVRVAPTKSSCFAFATSGLVLLALASAVFVALPAAASAQGSAQTAAPAQVPAAQKDTTSVPVAPPPTPRGKPLLLVEELEARDGFLTITFTVRDLFSPRIVETLGRGLPATLDYEIQLWKKRSVWFDKLVAVNRLSYRVKYDPWEEGFRIETRGGISPAIFDVEQIERSLCLHVTGRVADMELLEPLATHYVAVRATLKLLSAEDVGEVETWLSDGSDGGRGGITGIPRYLFDVIVGLSGFGDEAVNGRSAFFRVEKERVITWRE
jgi:hypothetical protein